MSYSAYNQLIFVIFMVLGLVLFYQSWINLAKKQLTSFSMDALILLYVRVFRGKEQLRRTKRLLSDEPQRLRILGVIAFISGTAAFYQAVNWYLRYLRL
jgi:hypothetical protein